MTNLIAIQRFLDLEKMRLPPTLPSPTSSPPSAAWARVTAALADTSSPLRDHLDRTREALSAAVEERSREELLFFFVRCALFLAAFVAAKGLFREMCREEETEAGASVPPPCALGAVEKEPRSADHDTTTTISASSSESIESSSECGSVENIKDSQEECREEDDSKDAKGVCPVVSKPGVDVVEVKLEDNAMTTAASNSSSWSIGSSSVSGTMEITEECFEECVGVDDPNGLDAPDQLSRKVLCEIAALNSRLDALLLSSNAGKYCHQSAQSLPEPVEDLSMIEDYRWDL